MWPDSLLARAARAATGAASGPLGFCLTDRSSIPALFYPQRLVPSVDEDKQQLQPRDDEGEDEEDANEVRRRQGGSAGPSSALPTLRSPLRGGAQHLKDRAAMAGIRFFGQMEVAYQRTRAARERAIARLDQELAAAMRKGSGAAAAAADPRVKVGLVGSSGPLPMGVAAV